MTVTYKKSIKPQPFLSTGCHVNRADNMRWLAFRTLVLFSQLAPCMLPCRCKSMSGWLRAKTVKLVSTIQELALSQAQWSEEGQYTSGA